MSQDVMTRQKNQAPATTMTKHGQEDDRHEQGDQEGEDQAEHPDRDPCPDYQAQKVRDAKPGRGGAEPIGRGGQLVEDGMGSRSTAMTGKAAVGAIGERGQRPPRPGDLRPRPPIGSAASIISASTSVVSAPSISR